ncbi:unnamed protein product [Acanthoscelides obtectus]|uniref:Uncharacterized protein n=1 Tax=Acanthoscelides obtectus TaxID=200917 RepID=A0A9P0JZM4_ACAOB|nr:unnamed protein product [Acanthoscelides obtectus]CAK1631556.1 hypothetical protein AOBTE_LOCUS7007 [Acanthoscelides obtectus]
MEVDSIHTCIEKTIRNRKINIPADYVHACVTSRQNPKRYNVRYITSNFLKEFDTLNYYKSIRPGRDTMVKICALKYDPSGKIYKLRHTDSWEQLNPTIKLSSPRLDSLHNMYQERRKIKKEKYEHLQIFKKTLLQDYYTFYDNLPYEKKITFSPCNMF